MRRVIVGNWKMNLNIRQSEVLVSRLKANITKPTASVVLCPTFISISSVSKDRKSGG